VFTFVMKKEGVEFGEALRMLADKAGLLYPLKSRRGPKKDEKDKLFQVNEAAAAVLSQPAGQFVQRGICQKSICSAAV